MFTSTGIIISRPESDEIVLPVVLIWPATNVFVNASDEPPDILLSKYDIIAACVGTILLELATNVASLLNSLITTAEPPIWIAPKLSSSNPDNSKKSALIDTTPVDCSTANSSPTLKLPSWSVLV